MNSSENYNFGELKEVNLREGWKHEALNFTKWLAEPKNLAMLGEEIGIMIKPEGTEVRSGHYYADIIGQTDDGDTVVIENQLERTDHEHLGKIIVYSAKNDAKIQVWVASDATEDHRQAVEWLNANSNENVNIFLVELQLLKIDDSKLAPKFTLVCGPNDWDKTNNTKDTAYRKFWEGFRDYCQNQGFNGLVSQNSPDRTNYNSHIGDSRYSLRSSFDTVKKEVAVQFKIQSGYQNDIYPILEQHRGEIEQEIATGGKWDWDKSRIKLIGNIPFSLDSDDLEKIYGWYAQTLQQFKNSIPRYLHNVE